MTPGHIFLVGFMGSGKSATGKALASLMGLPFIDLDEVVVTREGRSIATIFAEDGQPAFRAAESAALSEVAAGPPAVVATGGGIVLDEGNRRLLRGSGRVVHLRVSAEEALRRVGRGSGRPLLEVEDPLAEATRMLSERLPLYESAADLSVDTLGRTPKGVAEELAATFSDPDAASSAEGGTTFVLPVGTEPPYEVVIGDGVLGDVGNALRRFGATRVALITDENVEALYGERVSEAIVGSGVRVQPIVVPAGESSKSWERAGRVLSEMVRAGLDRRSMVVALGGGVVGDLAGFCASVYMRGIPVVQVPTTLLAQADSSIGGKTGVDLPAGKNLAGTFWQPSLVLADTSSLRTLQESEWRSGLAEVAKSAVLAGENETAALESSSKALHAREPEAVVEAVRMAAGLKASVVGDDERESGAREQLNYGHTFGHALELVLGYGTVPHGHAVAEGMRFAARLTRRIQGSDPAFIERQDRLLDSLGLTRLTFDVDADALLRGMVSDKKAHGGEIRFVLVPLPGTWETVSVSSAVLGEELRDYLDGDGGEGQR